MKNDEMVPQKLKKQTCRISGNTMLQDIFPAWLLDDAQFSNGMKHRLQSYISEIEGSELADNTELTKILEDSINHIYFFIDDLSEIAGILLAYKIRENENI